MLQIVFWRLANKKSVVHVANMTWKTQFKGHKVRYKANKWSINYVLIDSVFVMPTLLVWALFLLEHTRHQKTKANDSCCRLKDCFYDMSRFSPHTHALHVIFTWNLSLNHHNTETPQWLTSCWGGAPHPTSWSRPSWRGAWRDVWQLPHQRSGCRWWGCRCCPDRACRWGPGPAQSLSPGELYLGWGAQRNHFM